MTISGIPGMFGNDFCAVFDDGCCGFSESNTITLGIFESLMIGSIQYLPIESDDGLIKDGDRCDDRCDDEEEEDDDDAVAKRLVSCRHEVAI